VATLLEQILGGMGASEDDEFARMMARRFMGEVPFSQAPETETPKMMRAGMPGTQGGASRPPLRISGNPASAVGVQGAEGAQSGVGSVRPPAMADRTVPDRPVQGAPYTNAADEQTSLPGTSPPRQADSSSAARPGSMEAPSDTGPTFSERMINFGNALQGNAVTNYDDASRKMSRERFAQNKTVQWLVSKGVPQEEAEAVVGNPELMNSLIKQYTTPVTMTDDQREYAQAQKQGYKGTLVDFIKDSRRTNLPMKIDAGTEILLVDPATQAVLERIPKDVAGVAAAKKIGEGQGDAQVNLPKALEIGNRMIAQIDAVANDSYLPKMIGPVAGRMPNLSGEANTLQAKIDQIQGAAFLQAYEALRGAGAITEVEGEQAKASLTRLANMKQTEAGYADALSDARQNIIALVDIAKRKAAGDFTGTPQPSTSELPRVQTMEEARRLPKGSRFIDPNGIERVVP
jgi:hypothetical protein